MNTEETDVILGERYRDDLTGVEGVATARINFLHGCERVTLEVLNDKDGELKEYTFDAPRLIRVVTQQPVEMKVAKTGGSRPGPTRSGLTR